MSYAPWLAGILLLGSAQPAPTNGGLVGQGGSKKKAGRQAVPPVAPSTPAPQEEAPKISTEPVFPGPVDNLDRSAILGWKGLAYLGGAQGKLLDAYPVGYEWGSLKNAPAATPKTDWHLRVVILSGTTQELRDPNGVLNVDRHAIFNIQMNAVRESLNRLARFMSAASNGEVRLVPEITTETEELRGEPFGEEFAKNYFGPRMNGGGYEAEDKVFRGPYQSAIYIVPGARPDEQGLYLVNGTPVSKIPLEVLGQPTAPGELDQRLWTALERHAMARLARQGYLLRHGSPAATSWAVAAGTGDVPTDSLLARLKAGEKVSVSGVTDTHPIMGPASPATTVTVVSDSDHGQVLHITETGPERNGAFALPVRADGKPITAVKDASTIHFQIRTKAEDSLGIRLTDSQGKSGWISLGTPPTVTIAPVQGHAYNMPQGTFKTINVPTRHDGTWETVSVNLSGTGLEDVASIAVQPSPEAMQMGRIRSEPIECDIDEIKFDNEAAPAGAAQALAPSATSENPEERALFAAKATASSPELVALLNDKSSLVRLNAADAYTRLKDDTAQPNLVNDIVDLDPTIAAYAMKALMHQGGQVALFTAQKTVKLGVTPRVRETAARELGALKDAKYEADIDPLLTDRSRLNRIAAVEVFADIPSKSSALRRTAFLAQDDPDIKMTVVRTADPKDETQMRSILWSAVNEPSDLLRAECDIKLLQSPNAELRSEGYKGVRDDSRVTRLAVLDYLVQHPDEAHRNALRLAVTDRSPAVRAAALRGFSALEKGAEPDEIANVMQDRDPEVQLALLELAKRHGLKLSDETKKLMTESPDPRVPQALAAG